MTSAQTSTLLSHARTHLVLGRFSNLPTVWSNCIAAWVLASGGFTPVLLNAMASMSCLYIGGMYLNDACDAAYDAQYKPDRPIPQGLIHRTHVFMIAGFLFVAGLVLAFSWGWKPLFGAILLAGMIVAYNSLHLYFSWSPILMGACRMLVYVAVGLAAGGEHSTLRLLSWAAALGAYVVGFSFVARVEETNMLRRSAPLALLFAPVALGLFPLDNPTHVIIGLLPLAWICYCLLFVLRPAHRDFRRAVTGLIAGISLIDLLAASQITSPNPIIWQVIILGFFVITILAQKFIPAT